VNSALTDIKMISPAGTELARYSTSAGERVLMAWRRPPGVEVTDRPVRGRARGYVVDRNMRCPVQLGAFVEDYLRQASDLDTCPMDGGAIDRILGATECEAIDSLLERLV
jgi:hypothetical protein